MSLHFERELIKLREDLLDLSARVEEVLVLAIRCFENKDLDLARKVVKMDEDIDQREVAIEESCLKILALHQPVAIDLRIVVASLKINSDLERIADLAVNFARRTKHLIKKTDFSESLPLEPMANLVRKMLKEAIDSLLKLDAAKAIGVWEADNEVDDMHKSFYKMVYAKIRENPEQVEMYINQLSLSRYLERVGDFATNIAEDVVYLIDGNIIRHRTEQFLEDAIE